MSVRQRKKGSSKKNKSKANKSQQNDNKSKQSSTPKKKAVNKARPLIPLPLMFRVMIVSMFLMAVYVFKNYYVTKYAKHNSASTSSPIEEVDLTKVINSADLDLTKSKLKEISPRIKAKKKKKIPLLKAWTIENFWAPEMALNLSNQLSEEFMDEKTRNESFYFAFNKGNEKIRGNDDIEAKRLDAHSRKEGFAYCKYEYRRQLPLYQRILAYLNSSYAANIMSKVLKTEIVGVSDLFVSVYSNGDFLSMHDDRGLGHYAFVSFLSQDWDFANGGSLNFNCQDRFKWRESCAEFKPSFNDIVLFKVWPDTMPHFVKEVTVDQPRMAITGWYFNPNERGVHWKSIAEETGYGLK